MIFTLPIIQKDLFVYVDGFLVVCSEVVDRSQTELVWVCTCKCVKRERALVTGNTHLPGPLSCSVGPDDEP